MEKEEGKDDMTESIKIESDNKTEVQKFFDCVLKIMNGVGISAVFSQDICFGRTEEDARFYDISDDVIILFENGMCLDLDYRALQQVHPGYATIMRFKTAL